MKRKGMKGMLCLLALSAAFAFAGCGEETSAPQEISVASYGVTFVYGNGSANESRQAYEGEKINQSANPTKEGYIFCGWFKGNADGTEIADTAYDFFSNTVGGDTYLYAKWRLEDPIGEAVTQLTVEENEAGTTLTLSTTAEGVEYSLDGKTWQDSGVFTVENGTAYECSVRYKATATTPAGAPMTKRIVTKPAASDFTVVYPEGEYETLVVTPVKENVEYEYSLDGLEYHANNEFSGLPLFEATQTIYARIVGDYVLPPSRPLRIDAEIKHNPDQDIKEYLIKGWVMDGASVEITTSTAQEGLHGGESTNSIQLACDPKSVEGNCPANITFNRPNATATVAFDIYMTSETQGATLKLLGNANLSNYTIGEIGAGVWTRVLLKPEENNLAQGPLFQISFTEKMTVYIDNLTSVSPVEYESLTEGYATGATYTEVDGKVTITGTNSAYEYEYSVNGGGYTEDNTFTGVVGTRYTVLVRRNSTTVTYPDKVLVVSLTESAKLARQWSEGLTYKIEDSTDEIGVQGSNAYTTKLSLTGVQTGNYINLLITATNKTAVKFNIRVVDANDPTTPIATAKMLTNQANTNIDLQVTNVGQWQEMKLPVWGAAGQPDTACLLQISQLTQDVIVYIDEITPITMAEYLGGIPVTVTSENGTSLNQLGKDTDLGKQFPTDVTYSATQTTVKSIAYGHNRGVSIAMDNVDVSGAASLQFTVKFDRKQNHADMDFYIGKPMTDATFKDKTLDALLAENSIVKAGTYASSVAPNGEMQVTVSLETLESLGIDLTACTGFSFVYNDNFGGAGNLAPVTAGTIGNIKFALQ